MSAVVHRFLALGADGTYTRCGVCIPLGELGRGDNGFADLHDGLVTCQRCINIFRLQASSNGEGTDRTKRRRVERRVNRPCAVATVFLANAMLWAVSEIDWPYHKYIVAACAVLIVACAILPYLFPEE